MSDINDDVLAALEAEEAESGYDRSRLHYGELGSTCFRRDWYGLHLPREEWDEPTPESRFQLAAGKIWESVVIRALRQSRGEKIETQVSLMPLRPSAWPFAPMHIDALATERRHIYEVKARGTGHFARALTDPRKLVTDSHAWQASAYLDEARARGLADTASWIFVDRGGDHAMVEVQLTDDLMIHHEAIVAREIEKAPLVTALEPPPRAPATLVLKVWKTRGRVEAHEERYSLCSYCKFQNACQPGPEDRLVETPAALVPEAVARAEAAWAAGSKTTPFVARWEQVGGFGASDFLAGMGEEVKRPAHTLHFDGCERHGPCAPPDAARIAEEEGHEIGAGGSPLPEEPVEILTMKGGVVTETVVDPPEVTLTSDDVLARLGPGGAATAADLQGLTDPGLLQPTLTTAILNEAQRVHGRELVESLFVAVGGAFGTGKKIRRRLALSGARLRWFVSRLPVVMRKAPSPTTVADALSHHGTDRPLT